MLTTPKPFFGSETPHREHPIKKKLGRNAEPLCLTGDLGEKFFGGKKQIHPSSPVFAGNTDSRFLHSQPIPKAGS